jgi:hypothetical protein
MTTPSGGWIIRRQVWCLINEVLSDMSIDEEARLGLLRHLAEYPGNPEPALLAQVNDWQDREERDRPTQPPEA